MKFPGVNSATFIDLFSKTFLTKCTTLCTSTRDDDKQYEPHPLTHSYKCRPRNRPASKCRNIKHDLFLKNKGAQNGTEKSARDATTTDDTVQLFETWM